VTIPTDRNVTHRESENKLKYTILCIETQGMWNMKGMVIPVTTGDTGMVTKGLKQIWKP
jgi:hypothetical protein